MISMTEDMFIKQLSEYSKNIFNKVSYKNNIIQILNEQNQNIICYIEINKQKNQEGKWISKIHIKEPNNTLNTIEKEFDSYYKILMESKYVIPEIFNFNEEKKDITPSKIAKETVSTESIAGTWNGEESINKIVIMRGGRGFIIFKNGASMNIIVSTKIIDNNTYINIKQNGSSNASYFPELPRKTALEIAPNAKPIEWNLILKNDSTLEGSKNTISLNDNTIQDAKISVTWNKIN